MTLKERNKQIKKAVTKAYPNDKVSVTGGRGTATGWVDVKLTLKPSSECSCNFVERKSTWKGVTDTYLTRAERHPWTGNHEDKYQYYCPDCCERLEKEREKLTKIVYNCGAEFYHYTSDDIYNTQRAECLIFVEIEK